MADNDHRRVEGWPKYPSNLQFEMGSGIAVGDDGIIYCLTRDIEHWAAHPLAMREKMGRSSVSMFDREGTYLGKWGKSDEPGFALGGHTIYIIDGCFWITDRDGHTVRKYAKDGTLLLSLGTFGKWGDDAGHFNGPTGVAVLGDGMVVVTDGYWNSRLIWFTPQGKYIKEIGGWGNAPGQFNSPHAVACLPDDRIMVVDFRGGALHAYMTLEGQIAEHRKHPDPDRKSRIQIFDAEGNFLEEWTHLKPLSVAVYGERIYASDNMHDLLVLDAATGALIERHDNLTFYIHQFAMDAHGDFYTATVYPEHGGEKRGREGPSFRRWSKSG